MTDVPGVLRDKNDIGTKIQALDIRQCRELIQEGVIAGGMIPKVSGTGNTYLLRSGISVNGAVAAYRHTVIAWALCNALVV